MTLVPKDSEVRLAKSLLNYLLSIIVDCSLIILASLA